MREMVSPPIALREAVPVLVVHVLAVGDFAREDSVSR